MKRRLLVNVFVWMCLVAQTQDHLYSMQQTNLWNNHISSVKDLANLIEKNTSSAADKSLLAYEWVTQNISYSTDSVLDINWRLNFDEKVAATLRRKKGVCDNFASLYASLLQQMNIPATVVYGMSSLSGKAGHSWTAFYVDREWWLADPTWDAGSEKNFRYYKQTPSAFIQQHWPFDPLWQLMPTPITYAVFSGKERKTTRTLHFSNVGDSALAYLLADSLQQLHSANKRIEQMGTSTLLSDNWHAANRMNIAIIDEARNEQLYQQAVKLTNEANELLNIFIAYRNQQFSPTTNERNTKAMLENIPINLQKAKESIALMGIGTPNHQYDPTLLLEKIDRLYHQWKKQSSFVEQYYQLRVEKRSTIFYQ